MGKINKMLLTGFTAIYLIGAGYAMKTAETKNGSFSFKNQPSVNYELDNKEDMNKFKEYMRDVPIGKLEEITFKNQHTEVLGFKIGDTQYSGFVKKHLVREGNRVDTILRKSKREYGAQNIDRTSVDNYAYKSMNFQKNNPFYINEGEVICIPGITSKLN